MKTPTLIVWLLVAACIAVDLAMIGELQVRRNEWPGAGGILGLALVFTETSLLAFWLVFGHYNVAFRMITVAVGLFVISYLASYSTDAAPGELSFWFAVTLLLAGSTAAPLAVARGTRYELGEGHHTASCSSRPPMAAKQFTIWGLMSLMTATGVFFGAVRFAKVPPLGLVVVGLFGSIQACTSCGLLFIAMQVRSWSLIVLFNVVICPIAGLLLFQTGVAPDKHPLPLILCVCLQGMLTVVAVQVLKQSGYVLTRAKKPSTAMASESSAASESTSADQHDEP